MPKPSPMIVDTIDSICNAVWLFPQTERREVYKSHSASLLDARAPFDSVFVQLLP